MESINETIKKFVIDTRISFTPVTWYTTSPDVKSTIDINIRWAIENIIKNEIRKNIDWSIEENKNL